jgi:hypothetical protein
VIDPEVLKTLARETAGRLAELGVRATDEKWIREHAATLAGLARPAARRRLPAWLYRLARRAARTAR